RRVWKDIGGRPSGGRGGVAGARAHAAAECVSAVIPRALAGFPLGLRADHGCRPPHAPPRHLTGRWPERSRANPADYMGLPVGLPTVSLARAPRDGGAARPVAGEVCALPLIGVTVLVVDDHEDSQAALREMT